MSWMESAACLGMNTEHWFVPDGVISDQSFALGVCRGCEVREECLEYAFDNKEDDGIFGGLTATQRTSLLRRQAKPRTPSPDRPVCGERGCDRTVFRAGLCRGHERLSVAVWGAA